MTDLATRYLGLELRSPLVASASPLSGTADGVRRLADSGVGAVVLPSLFEEQLRQEAARDAAVAGAGADSFAESLSYFPAAASADGGPDRYLSLLKRAAAARGHPGDRQPQRSHHRRVDGLCERPAGRGGCRDRAEHLLPARRPPAPHPPPRPSPRPLHLRQRRGAAPRRDPDHGQGSGHRAGGGEAQPVLQLDRRDGTPAGPGRGRRPGAVQPVPAA